MGQICVDTTSTSTLFGISICDASGALNHEGIMRDALWRRKTSLSQNHRPRKECFFKSSQHTIDSHLSWRFFARTTRTPAQCRHTRVYRRVPRRVVTKNNHLQHTILQPITHTHSRCYTPLLSSDTRLRAPFECARMDPLSYNCHCPVPFLHGPLYCPPVSRRLLSN